jgi:hypothetical protein
MNKLITGIVLGVLILGGAYFFYANRNAAKPTYAVDPQNASYSVESKTVPLIAGEASLEIVPGSASKAITQIFGAPTTGDLNGDGKIDAAVMLTQNSGGSGTFYYVAAAINTGKATQGTNAILLGDRIAPQTLEVRGGQIIANYADRKPGEPMSARPSVGVSKYFMVQNGVLVQSASASQ